MVFEAHGMSFPCTELLLFNYAKVKYSFPFYGIFKKLYILYLYILYIKNKTYFISAFFLFMLKC